MVSPRAWFELVMEEAIKKNPALHDVTRVGKPQVDQRNLGMTCLTVPETQRFIQAQIVPTNGRIELRQNPT